MKKIRYVIKGMSCAACVSHVEHAAKKVILSENFSVSLLTNTLTVTLEDEVNEEKLFDSLRKEISLAGYGLMREKTRKDSEEETKKQNKSALLRLIASCILTVSLMYVSMGSMIGIPVPKAFSENAFVFALIQFFLTIPVIILNFKFYKNGYAALFRLAPNMDSLIAIGSSASLIYGIVAIAFIGYGLNSDNLALVHSYRHNLYFESAAMILTLVSLGKMLEGRAKANAASAIGKLADMMPSSAIIIKDGVKTEVLTEEIKVGDIVVIRAGEIIPIDGIIINGNASVDESAISGESIPVEKAEGDEVRAVCTLTGGYIEIRAERVGSDTSLSKIINLLEDAAASKAPISRLADRVSRIFVPIVISISLITAVIWLIFTRDIAMAFECAVSVLVISCPCALGLATPTAIMVATGRGAQRGILIKSAEALEDLHSIKYFLTDKTGTLTEGKPSVTDIIPFSCEASELISVAYSAEAMSSHPLAEAVCRKAEEMAVEKRNAENFSMVLGMGIGAYIDGRPCFVGKPEFLFENGVDINDSQFIYEQMETLENEGKTAVCVSFDGHFTGIIGIADKLREDSVKAISDLKKMGVVPVMLTGDNERTASAVAKSCGIDEVYSRLLPEDKERLIREFSEKGKCAMIGDGINDAPALAAADIGIAVGAGTEVAIDCADVVLSKSSFSDAVAAIKLSRATITCIRENLFWALIYNTICIPIAAGVLYPAFNVALSPMIASAAMSFSSIFVVLNSLRLKIKNIGFENKKINCPCENNKSEIQKEDDDMFGKNKTVNFSVEGMMCEHCKAHVEKALLDVKGVKSATADLASKSVTVVVKDSVSEDTLKAAVVAAGYKA